MVVRITKLNGSKPSVLKVDGLLEAADVGVLQHECASVAGAVTLDLSELRSADGGGVDAIRFLESQGAKLRGLCPYLELLLRAGRSNGEASDSKDQIHK